MRLILLTAAFLIILTYANESKIKRLTHEKEIYRTELERVLTIEIRENKPNGTAQ